MKKITSLIAMFMSLVLGTLIISSYIGHAQSTPAYKVSYIGDKNNTAVFPGGSKSFKYKISNSDENNAIIMKLEGEGADADGSITMPRSWFSISETNKVVINPKMEAELSITVNVPPDASFGKYSGMVSAAMLSYGPPNKLNVDGLASSGAAGVSVGTAIGEMIYLNVVDKAEYDKLKATETNEAEEIKDIDDTESSENPIVEVLGNYWFKIALIILALVILGKIFLSSNNKKTK